MSRLPRIINLATSLLVTAAWVWGMIVLMGLLAPERLPV